jgi:pilus assembly protein Flp/PilA
MPDTLTATMVQLDSKLVNEVQSCAVASRAMEREWRSPAAVSAGFHVHCNRLLTMAKTSGESASFIVAVNREASVAALAFRMVWIGPDNKGRADRAQTATWIQEQIMKTLQHFAKDESGATAIEYGLIAAGISVAIITVVNGLGKQLVNTFTNVSTKLGNAGQ